tara:strand:+ start:5803 stop:6210 length:408 start_codon:yes stop_codon:yes gene_type:complete
MKKKEITSVENNSLFNYILKGGITGILVAYVIIYALRPSVPYPDFIIEIFENYFMFIILLLINFYLFLWDKLIGTLFFVCIISLVFDYFIFIKKDLVKIKNFDNQVVIENFRDKKETYMEKFKNFLNVVQNSSYL